MDWLTKLPVVGPWMTRLMHTHLWRTYETLDRTRWSQLAAAMTYISFLALFPLLTLVAAVAASTLSRARQRELQDQLAEQVPGISDQLDIASLVDNSKHRLPHHAAPCSSSPASAGSARSATACAPSGNSPPWRATRSRARPRT